MKRVLRAVDSLARLEELERGRLVGDADILDLTLTLALERFREVGVSLDAQALPSQALLKEKGVGIGLRAICAYSNVRKESRGIL